MIWNFATHIICAMLTSYRLPASLRNCEMYLCRECFTNRAQETLTYISKYLLWWKSALKAFQVFDSLLSNLLHYKSLYVSPRFQSQLAGTYACGNTGSMLFQTTQAIQKRNRNRDFGLGKTMRSNYCPMCLGWLKQWLTSSGLLFLFVNWIF